MGPACAHPPRSHEMPGAAQLAGLRARCQLPTLALLPPAAVRLLDQDRRLNDRQACPRERQQALLPLSTSHTLKFALPASPCVQCCSQAANGHGVLLPIPAWTCVPTGTSPRSVCAAVIMGIAFAFYLVAQNRWSWHMVGGSRSELMEVSGAGPRCWLGCWGREVDKGWGWGPQRGREGRSQDDRRGLQAEAGS